MKKIYLALILLICTVQLEAQQTTAIPDSNFEQAIIDLGYDIGTPDGFVLTDSIKKVKGIWLNYKNVSDLTGIQDFAELTQLGCDYNNLSTLDISKCTNLKRISCISNKLNSINLPNSIEDIILTNNLLKEIDISKCIGLIHLQIDNNSLSTINLKNNINLGLLLCNNNILKNLDLSTNNKLYYVKCGNNLLTSLEVSGKDSLFDFECNNNNLTFLSVTNNHILGGITCTNNKLININISGCSALTDLGCENNNLNTLDISQLSKLEDLRCNNNFLNSLDCHNNSHLKWLFCNNNNLNYLNIKNGNNINIQRIESHNNPNLKCIIVDNQWNSISYWDSKNLVTKDLETQYSNISCGNNIISGNIYNDLNLTCSKNNTEKNLNKYLIKATGKTELYSLTNSNGNFTFFVDSNSTYKISVLKSKFATEINNICNNNEFIVNSGKSGNQIDSINIGVHLKDCSLLSVELSKTRMRRCFRNATSIIYRNYGSQEEYNAKIYIDYPEYVSLVSASQLYSTVNSSNKIYVFTIDTVKAFSEHTISLIDSVMCGDEDIRGYTQCIRTWITPKSNCTQTKSSIIWDESDIIIDQKPKNLGDSLAQFTIKNCGTGNMTNPQQFRLFYNNELADTGRFQLQANDSLIIGSSADGSTIRLEADQCQNHPGQSIPRATIEGCGSSTPAKASLGFWPRSICDDLDPDVSEICLDIKDSYDPNEKTVSPSGITAKNYVPTKGPLHYSIGFQNTGSDTAYKIVVVDTLSKNLDLSTLVITGASHKYTYSISGQSQPILEFTFNNINLPDSTTDEAHSHGFISYTLYPNDSIIPKSTIDNFADIYFDYNSPIRTNTTHVVAFDTTIVSNKIISVKLISSPTSILDLEVPKIKISPNPCSQNIEVESLNNDYNLLKIYSSNGSLILTKTISCKDKIDVSTLTQGVYFITISNHAGNLFKYEIIKK